MARPPCRYATQEGADRIRQMEAGGMHRNDIARVLGITPTTLRRVCRMFSLPPADRYAYYRGRKEALRAEILRLCRVMPQKKVARKLCCSNSTVKAVMLEDNPFHYGGRGPKPREEVVVPRWVPTGWEEEYAEMARERGEEAAAAWVRAAKREAAMPD